MKLLIRPGSPLQESCHNTLVNQHSLSARCQDNPGRINKSRCLMKWVVEPSGKLGAGLLD